MPSIQILPSNEQPSFSSELGRNLGAGIGKGLQTSLQSFLESKGKFGDQLEKARLSARQKLPGIIKNYAPIHEGDEEYANKKLSQINDLLSQGLPESHAIEMALGIDIPGEGFEVEEIERKPQSKGFSLEDPIAKAQKNDPYLKLLKESPLAALQALALGPLSANEELLRGQSQGGREFVESLGFNYPENEKEKTLPVLSEILRDLIQKPLSEEAKRGTEFPELLGSLLPVGRAGKKLLKDFRKGKLGEKAAKAAEAFKGTEKSRKAFQEAGKAKATEEGAKGAAPGSAKAKEKVSPEQFKKTSERTKRSFKEGEKFSPKEEVKLREEQLKSEPKLKKEIEEEKARHAESQEKKRPKTATTQATHNRNVKQAADALPEAEKKYKDAIREYRKIQDELVSATGKTKEHLKNLLSDAKSNVRNAQINLNRTRSNLRKGTKKSSVESNTEAARKKVEKLKDDIAEGKEIKLSLHDYNPETVKRAEKISKSKAVPSKGQESFYESVHKEYGKVYKDALDKVEKEIENLSGSIKSMSDAQKLSNLQKERDILKKMHKQAEADAIIGERRLRLREVGKRKELSERMKLTQKLPESERAKKIRETLTQKPSSEKPKSRAEKFEESSRAKSLREKIPSRDFDEIKTKAEEKFKDNPVQKKEIKEKIESTEKETSKFSQALKKVAQESTGKTEKEAVKEAKSLLERYLDKLRRTYPPKSILRDAIIGSAAAFIKDEAKESGIDLPANTNTFIAAVSGHYRGTPIRILSNQITQWVLQNRKINNVASAYREKDSKKLAELRSKYSPSIIKKGREKARGR